MSDASHVWTPPADVRAAGETAQVPYRYAEETQAGEQREPYPALVALRDAIVRTWPGVSSGGMKRDSSRIGTISHDVHKTGRAVDFMLRDTPLRPAQGDALANFLVLNAQLLQLQYVLWSETELSTSNSGSRWERYTSSPEGHYDHVHVEIGPVAQTWTYAQMQTRVDSALASLSGDDTARNVVLMLGAGGVTVALAWWFLNRR